MRKHLRFGLIAFAVALAGLTSTPACWAQEAAPDVVDGSMALPESSVSPDLHAAAPWSDLSGTTAWTNAAIAVIRTRIQAFENARDKDQFCPGYTKANQRSREICWLRLIGGVAFYESAFKADAMFREANGTYSVGLLALSEHECDDAPTKSKLKNPQLNLECGIAKMAELIEQDGFIDGPSSARGAAAYWSTLRDPYHANHMHLGQRAKIQAITKKYQAF